MKSSFFESHLHGNLTVLVIQLERLSEEENLEQLDNEWNALIEKEHLQSVVLDLGAVIYMTSAAIGRLIGLHRRMNRQQGQLILCSLQQDVRNVLSMSHLLSYFQVAGNRDDALALAQPSAS